MLKEDIIINTREILKWQILLLIDFIILILVIFIGYKIYKNLTKKNKSKIISMIPALIFIILMIKLGIDLLGSGTLYSIDYALENYDVKEEVIENIDRKRTIIEIETIDSNYYFSTFDFESELTDREIVELLEDNFKGHLCEIQYYKFSKYVQRITVLNK